MKRFAFSLERVLHFRRQVEELERRRLEALAARKQGLLAQAAQFRQEACALRAEFGSRSTVTGLDLRRAHEYAQALGRAGEQAIADSERVEQQRLSQISVVVQARRDVKLLELLRAKRFRRHSKLSDREQETIAAELHLAKLRWHF